jgi:hypothetical protein
MAIAWLTVTLLAFELPAVNLGTFLSGNPHMIAVMVKRALSTLFGLPLCYHLHRVLSRQSLVSWRRRVIAWR